MENRAYITDFYEDLDDRRVILYIGNVDQEKLSEALKKSAVNKLFRFGFAISDTDPSRKTFIYVEEGDLKNLNYPIYEYIDVGYDVYVLYEDAGQYYVETKMDVVEYVQKVIGLDLLDSQKELLRKSWITDPDYKFYICMSHRCGRSMCLEHLRELSKIIFNKGE